MVSSPQQDVEQADGQQVGCGAQHALFPQVLQPEDAASAIVNRTRSRRYISNPFDVKRGAHSVRSIPLGSGWSSMMVASQPAFVAAVSVLSSQAFSDLQKKSAAVASGASGSGRTALRIVKAFQSTRWFMRVTQPVWKFGEIVGVLTASRSSVQRVAISSEGCTPNVRTREPSGVTWEVAWPVAAWAEARRRNRGRLRTVDRRSRIERKPPDRRDEGAA